MRNMKSIILSSDEIVKFVKSFGLNQFMDASIKYIEKGFIDYASGKLQKNKRVGFLFQKNTIEAMPCRRVGKGCCFKIVNFHEKNKEEGLPSVMGILLYLDEKNGFPIIVTDATFLTAIRTGAATGLATKYLAPGATRIGIIGTGVIGQTSLHAISRVCDIEKVFVYDTNQKILKRFKQQMARLLDVPIEIKSPKEIVKNSDVITTCTYGNRIVVKNAWIKAGERKLINTVGTDTPGKIEIEPTLYKRAKIIVDFKEQAVKEGDVSNPIKQGIIDEKDIFAELHEIIVKNKNITKEDKLIIFDSTGDPIEDLVMAELLLEKGKFEKKHFVFIPKRESDFYYDF